MESPREILKIIASGRGFYFHFTTIDVYKNDVLLKHISPNNCEDSSSVFSKGGPFGGMVAKLDFEEEGFEEVQTTGAFRGLYSGFDLFLSNAWQTVDNTDSKYSIAYYLMGGGIDMLMLEAGIGPNDVSMHILTEDGFMVKLSKPISFSVR